MGITIRSVEGTSGRNEFIKAQWAFYKDDPNWVPPLLMDRRKILDPKKNAFFQHAKMQLFIAEKDGKLAGRIAAITNENHNRTHEDSLGFFGFFESINDQGVASALFDAAAVWLRERGMTAMRGPFNPSVNDEIGLLIEGLNQPAVILMTYNPPYYPALFEGYGLSKSKDLYAYLLHNELVTTPKLERGQQLVRDRFKITVRGLDWKNLDKEFLIIKDLYNRSWQKNWGAVALTDPEFDALAKDLSQVVGKFKDLVFIAEKDGVPAGFTLCLPDINQVLLHNPKGRLLPAVWKLMTKSKDIDLVRIIALGVLQEYQGKGIDAVMYWETVTRAAKHGILKGEASWVLEDNLMMNRGAELMNSERYKTYRIYDKAL